MATDFRQEKKKQQYLIGAIVLVVVITISVLWFGVLREKEPSMSVNIQPTDLVGEINIDLTILENSFFDQIKPFQKIPKFEGGIGRSNPFLPY